MCYLNWCLSRGNCLWVNVNVIVCDFIHKCKCVKASHVHFLLDSCCNATSNSFYIPQSIDWKACQYLPFANICSEGYRKETKIAAGLKEWEWEWKKKKEKTSSTMTSCIQRTNSPKKMSHRLLNRSNFLQLSQNRSSLSGPRHCIKKVCTPLMVGQVRHRSFRRLTPSCISSIIGTGWWGHLGQSMVNSCNCNNEVL